MVIWPPRASTRSTRPVSPDPLAVSAPPSPSSRIRRCRLAPSASTRTSYLGGLCVFGRVGEGFGDDVVGGHFDRAGQPSMNTNVELDRDRRAAGQRLERGAPSSPGPERGRKP